MHANRTPSGTFTIQQMNVPLHPLWWEHIDYFINIIFPVSTLFTEVNE